jgi:hypothetical protein
MAAVPTIQLDTGIKKVKIQVVNGVDYDLIFNPNDTLMISQLHDLYFKMVEKSKEIEKLQETFGEPELDENGVPLDINPVIQETNDFNQLVKDRIDVIFGKGTSQAIYGKTMFYSGMLHVYTDLISGLLSFAEPIRAQKVARHVVTKKPANGRKRHTTVKK